MPDVTLLLGDCLTLLPTLADASVDAVVTDPPYGTGQWRRAATGAGSDPTAVYAREAWDVFSLSWLPDALRVSRGPVAIFTPSGRLPDVMALAAEQHLSWRLLIWCKSDPRPRHARQTAYGFELIIVLRGLLPTGDKDYFLASAPRLHRDREAVGHPHQKPSSLIRWVVNRTTAPGNTVLDPFMGSGTTGVACVQEDRAFIGMEKDAGYFAVGQARIAAAQAAPRQPVLLEVAG